MKRITIEIPDSKYAKLTADAEKLIAVKSKMCRSGSALGGAYNVCSVQMVCKRKRKCLRGSRGEH